ncbi:MAG TPA: DUF63 family protein [Methanocorpusculum sp.]|nr:DUF63 family protein [Methanocorpusculum sp.]HJJ52966.1 DUF63 family protein [Methanocorpusculum sp.]
MLNELYKWIVELEGSTYTVLQTVLYALLVLAGLYILYRWLKKTNIPINAPLILSGLSYIIFGALLRVVEDTGMVPEPWWILFVTPQVYILTAIFAVVMLFISWQLQKKNVVVSYTTPFMIGGVVPSLITAGFLLWFGVTQSVVVDVGAGLIVFLIAAASTAALWAVLRYVFRWEYVNHPLYLVLIAGHMLDASATSYALSFKGYIEQHVLGSTLIELTGTPYVMFALKIVVLIPAIWVLEKFRKEEGMSDIWHLVLLAMIIVGLAPGLRDVLRMVLGI